MEKLVVKFGFGMVCFFFFLMLTVGSQFTWGVLIGLAITLFGWFFWEE